LIDEKQRWGLISQFELLNQFQRSSPRIGSHHAKPLSVLAPQIPLNRPKHVHIIVNSENHWFFHACRRPRNLAVGMPFLLFGSFITCVRLTEVPSTKSFTHSAKAIGFLPFTLFAKHTRFIFKMLRTRARPANNAAT
jgi:hypothetical protein